MPQVDAVAVLQHGVVVVGQAGLEDGADADGAACSGTHPDHVVVAPLDIHAVVPHQQFQNDVRAGAAVEQVAHDVQLVHGQPLDQLAQTDDELVGPAVLDDAAHDLPVIQVLVVVLKVGVEQLIQDIAAAGGQALPHMLPGVLEDTRRQMSISRRRVSVYQRSSSSSSLQRFLSWGSFSLG